MRVLLTIMNAIRLTVAMLRGLHPAAHPPPLAPNVMTHEEVDRALTAAASAPEVSDATDWRNSIVDLMKILRLDSSLTAREELASELGYTGARDGSAAMNMWLHREVMKKVAEHSYAVPTGHD